MVFFLNVEISDMSIDFRSSALALSTAVALALAAPVAVAQPGPSGGPGSGWGPGMMMGPGMMGGGNMGFMCNPRAAGMAEWRLARIEAAVKPTAPQKEKLEALRQASAKAAETLNAACASAVPATSTERLALMEKRTEAALQAIKQVRPAFDALYATLDADQKSKLDAIGPRRWGWQNWRWR